jgi:hypothetical protein
MVTRSLDKESNVYRFGVLLLELISGHQPHKPGDVNVVDSVLFLESDMHLLFA